MGGQTEHAVMQFYNKTGWCHWVKYSDDILYSKILGLQPAAQKEKKWRTAWAQRVETDSCWLVMIVGVDAYMSMLQFVNAPYLSQFSLSSHESNRRVVAYF